MPTPLLLIFGIVGITAAIIASRTYLSRKRNNKTAISFDNKKHFEFVNEVMKSDGRKSIPESERPIDAYRAWCEEKFPLIRKISSVKNRTLLHNLIDEGAYLDYWPGGITYFDPEITGQEASLFIDCFTEVFPSTHDMDTWAIGTKLTEMFILSGYTDPKVAKKSILYIKKHFVNHSLTRGIIQFNLYLPYKEPGCTALFQRVKEIKAKNETQNVV